MSDVERPKARELNNEIRYVLYAVFKAVRPPTWPSARRPVPRCDELLEQFEAKGVVTRGCYDVAGFRADADYMFWWVAPSSDDLQEVYSPFRRTRLGRRLRAGLVGDGAAPAGRVQQEPHPGLPRRHRPAKYVCVYPFVRSYEWYLLPDEERRAMLAEHGQMARDYPDVRANTVASFALGDYEWMLAFEADELHRIVDLMRHLRGAQARRAHPR